MHQLPYLYPTFSFSILFPFPPVCLFSPIYLLHATYYELSVFLRTRLRVSPYIPTLILLLINLVTDLLNYNRFIVLLWTIQLFLRTRLRTYLTTIQGNNIVAKRFTNIYIVPIPDKVQLFLGSTNFYWWFIQDFSHHAFDLTKNDAIWKWGSDEQTAFNVLKEKITSISVLTLLENSCPFHIEVDSLDFTTGACCWAGILLH